jgi:hypothetical protein
MDNLPTSKSIAFREAIEKAGANLSFATTIFAKSQPNRNGLFKTQNTIAR